MNWFVWLIIELAMPGSVLLLGEMIDRTRRAKQQHADATLALIGMILSIGLLCATTWTVLMGAWIGAWNMTGQTIPSALWVVARGFGCALIIVGVCFGRRYIPISSRTVQPIPLTRTAKLRLNGGHHTQQEWRELCAKYNHRCLACGQRLPLTKDHIVPVHLGGSDDIDNIQPLCRSCNSSKNARVIDYRPQAPYG